MLICRWNFCRDLSVMRHTKKVREDPQDLSVFITHKNIGYCFKQWCSTMSKHDEVKRRISYYFQVPAISQKISTCHVILYDTQWKFQQPVSKLGNTRNSIFFFDNSNRCVNKKLLDHFENTSPNVWSICTSKVRRFFNTLNSSLYCFAMLLMGHVEPSQKEVSGRHAACAPGIVSISFGAIWPRSCIASNLIPQPSSKHCTSNTGHNTSTFPALPSTWASLQPQSFDLTLL